MSRCLHLPAIIGAAPLTCVVDVPTSAEPRLPELTELSETSRLQGFEQARLLFAAAHDRGDPGAPWRHTCRCRYESEEGLR